MKPSKRLVLSGEMQQLEDELTRIQRKILIVARCETDMELQCELEEIAEDLSEIMLNLEVLCTQGTKSEAA